MTGDRSNSTLYGKGVFTTVAVVDGDPLLWPKHRRRLLRDAKALDIDLSNINEEGLFSALRKTIDSEEAGAGRIRITIRDESSSQLWPPADAERTASFSIIAGKTRDVARSFRITTSKYLLNSTSPLAGIKSCNYLEPVMAYQDASRRGYHEAIRINEASHVTGACMANVFWLKRGEMFTPALSTGCLPGTTREYVIENIDCREVEVGLSEIENADAIYLTSAGLGIVCVDEFDGRRLDLSPHPIMTLWPPA